MREFNAVVAHFGGAALTGRLQALEGGRGLMRIALDPVGGDAALQEGAEGVLEMHDGARFRVSVQEKLADAGEWRVKLIGRA
ncbi:hypothetical protein HNQ07_001938 [Deinococcus metalli]|uniref:Uncharacterized protein n=1 Tax=Deinococcus metalli TaxID=1141878 RepID=A0A7W8NN37_9DEIO|nr:hypothetical protein [Deinococcus metalli]MBB5376474.1 hypothetical protein [Deinococcus metalli]GHF43766.1 hypothetical protein GCM10017781_20270 [Deinococcus metalli]